MKSQNFRTFLVILMGSMALIVIGGCASQGNQPGSQMKTTPDTSSTPVAATLENLQFIDFHFTPLDPNDSRLKNAISQDQAVLAALKFAPEGKKATSVTTQVGFSDGVMVMDLPKDRLVWLVTFHGVDSVSSGPPGSTHRVSHELTVAVDAYSGNAIVSFTLGIVTPQPMVPTSTQSQPSPTLLPTWGLQGHIYPPTIQAYVDEVHLDQTTRIEFTHPVSHEQVVITSQSMIQAIVELLDSPMDNCTGSPESTDDALLIIMNVPAEGGENIISMDYRPLTSDVLLDNIPTGSWPIKIQGSYSVCPDFGKSLFELLGIVTSTGTELYPTYDWAGWTPSPGEIIASDSGKTYSFVLTSRFSIVLKEAEYPAANLNLNCAPGAALGRISNIEGVPPDYYEMRYEGSGFGQCIIQNGPFEVTINITEHS
ncbi:MAG TPA: hypothetical protein PLA02_10755 [Brevefilum fermentans]|nr:hypothetical protein [Brevefilum fermentans]HQJ33409.1 hypothetical protein [Anaerolineaceae bacterium]